MAATNNPHGLSNIAVQQSPPTEETCSRVNQFLDYMATHPDANIRCRASDIALNVHSDYLYLSAPRAHSQAGSYFFLSSIPQDSTPIQINCTIHITCTILKLVVASAAEAELGTLFLNAQDSSITFKEVFEFSMCIVDFYNRFHC